MADFLKHADLTIQPTEILNGIENHRATDKFTDSHPSILALRSVFNPEFRRFVPIMLDVSFDHMLAKSWDRYHSLTLESFTQLAHSQMESAERFMPDLMRDRLRGMADHGWLASYVATDTIEKTLISISRRIRFENNLDEAYVEVLNQYDVIEATFDSFFPELVRHIKDLNIESE